MSGAGDRLVPPRPHLAPRLVPSPAGTANRCRTGQDLRLNRTMLSDHESPYVGRFACDWHRLATTDPTRPSPISLRARPTPPSGPARPGGEVGRAGPPSARRWRSPSSRASAWRSRRRCRWAPRRLGSRAVPRLRTIHSVASAWLAKDRSMTPAGWPSAALRFTRRPSASSRSRRRRPPAPATVNSSTIGRTSLRRPSAIAARPDEVDLDVEVPGVGKDGTVAASRRSVRPATPPGCR